MTVLVLSAAATWAMVGLIWMVQLVHYPLFARVGPQHVIAYEREHTRRITWVVLPLMMAELACTAVLAAWLPPGPARSTAWVGAGLLAVVWASTALVQVPQHERLSHSWDAAVHRALVRGNWVRTLAWSARGVLALLLL